INAIIIDKTGTITEGKPKVTDIQWLDNDDTAKTVLLSIEKQSEHPLADAVVKYFSQETAVELSNFESITGKGVQADYNNQTYYVGHKQLTSEQLIEIIET